MRYFKIILIVVVSSISHLTFALANPAAEFCHEKNNTYVMIKNTGICIFKDGSYCEEWAYYRNTCFDGINFFPGGGFSEDRISNYCISKKDGVTHVVKCP